MIVIQERRGQICQIRGQREATQLVGVDNQAVQTDQTGREIQAGDMILADVQKAQAPHSCRQRQAGELIAAQIHRAQVWQVRGQVEVGEKIASEVGGVFEAACQENVPAGIHCHC